MYTLTIYVNTFQTRGNLKRKLQLRLAVHCLLGLSREALRFANRIQMHGFWSLAMQKLYAWKHENMLPSVWIFFIINTFSISIT